MSVSATSRLLLQPLEHVHVRTRMRPLAVEFAHATLATSRSNSLLLLVQSIEDQDQLSNAATLLRPLCQIMHALANLVFIKLELPL